MNTIFINNEFIDAENGELSLLNPATGEEIAKISRGSYHEVSLAVAAARKASKTWRKMSHADRAEILVHLHNLIMVNFDTLIEAEILDTGKPVTVAGEDVLSAARYFKYYASLTSHLTGEVLAYYPGSTAMTVREPKGVTGHITPWNYPIQLFARTVAPSLAAGNCVVVKPAELACLSVVRLCELIEEAGFPPGVINVVTGLGTEAGTALTLSKIDHLSFIGSRKSGATVMQNCAEACIPLTLELGGKSANVIFPDADLKKAADLFVANIIDNTGQVCSAASRVIIHEEIYDEFTQMLAERIRKVKTGKPFSDPNCGPLISRSHQAWIDIVHRDLASVGNQIAVSKINDDVDPAGFYTVAALYDQVDPGSTWAQDELFAPILLAFKFSTVDEAISLLNGTEYGLAAGAWTYDSRIQKRMIEEIEAGQVFINTYGGVSGMELPFGGVKGSGFGKEKGIQGMLELTNLKTVVIA